MDTSKAAKAAHRKRRFSGGRILMIARLAFRPLLAAFLVMAGNSDGRRRGPFFQPRSEKGGR
jgi:hypothetical protein